MSLSKTNLSQRTPASVGLSAVVRVKTKEKLLTPQQSPEENHEQRFRCISLLSNSAPFACAVADGNMHRVGPSVGSAVWPCVQDRAICERTAITRQAHRIC